MLRQALHQQGGGAGEHEAAACRQLGQCSIETSSASVSSKRCTCKHWPEHLQAPASAALARALPQALEQSSSSHDGASNKQRLLQNHNVNKAADRLQVNHTATVIEHWISSWIRHKVISRCTAPREQKQWDQQGGSHNTAGPGGHLLSSLILLACIATDINLNSCVSEGQEGHATTPSGQ